MPATGKTMFRGAFAMSSAYVAACVAAVREAVFDPISEVSAEASSDISRASSPSFADFLVLPLAFLMAFFAFLPTIGEAIAIVLGLMRSNVWLTGSAMLAGKTLRYIVVLATFRGALSLF